MAPKSLAAEGYNQWLAGLKEKIRNSQLRAALKVNSELLSLYWELGKAIIDKQAESGWGDKIIPQLSRDLSSEFPEIKGFSVTNLKYIRRWFQFYSSQQVLHQPTHEYRPLEIGQQAVDQIDEDLIDHHVDHQIGQQAVDQTGQSTSGQLPHQLSFIPWGHHIQVITKTKSVDEALFYLQETAKNNWSRNILVHQIDSGLYQRKGKAITNFHTVLPAHDSELARELLKNPYNFDFLSLGPKMSERDLENALIANIKKFLLELGTGFAFVGQQYQLKVGENEYYIDLLFYHTKLHCYVVVELKISDFVPEFAGKLEFYLTAVDEQLKSESDRPSIGLLLCKSFDKVVVEYSLRNKSKPMGIAEYRHALPEELKAELPSEEVLKEQLSVEVAVPSSPLQEKIARLKDLINKSGKEEIQKKKHDDDVRYLFSQILIEIKDQIISNLQLIIPEFTRVESGRRINSTSYEFYTDVDLDTAFMKGDVTTIGLYLRLEGFKKGGTKTFDISKELFFNLGPYKYIVEVQRDNPWLERLYHQRWTAEQIAELANRWCEELIEEITERVARLD